MTAPPAFDSFPGSQRPAPSFSSFPEPSEERHRKRKRKDKHRERPRPEASAHAAPRREEYRPALTIASPSVFPTRSKPTSADPIVLDGRGDAGNEIYGGLYAGDIARFFRTNAGRVIGLHPSLRIIQAHKSKRRNLIVLPRNQHTLARYLDHRYSWKLLQNDVKLLEVLPSHRASAPAEFESLLAEDLPSKRPQDKSAVPDYRRLELDSDSDMSSEDELAADIEHENASSYLDRLSKRNAELSKRCSEQPQDIDQWLEFVRFQDLRHTAARSLASREERAATAEAKLAILDKAILHNKNSTVLVKERLRIGQDIWPADELEREWRKAMKRSAEVGHSLSLDWLRWRASDGHSFKLRSGFLRAAESALSTCAVEEKLEAFQLVAQVLYYSGYRERAHALYQAVIEYNLCTPSNLTNAPHGDLLDEFELFWEAEVPRFGEASAKGWANASLDDDPPPSAVPLASQALVKVENDVNGFEMWANREANASLEKSYPLRLVDAPEDDDDIYSVVLATDIKPFLFQTPQSDALIRIYLEFLGCTLPSLQCSNHFPNNPQRPVFSTFWPEPVPEEAFQVIAGEAMEPTRRALASLKAYELRLPCETEILFPSTSAIPWLNSSVDIHFQADPVRLRQSLAFLHTMRLLSTDLRAFYIAFEAHQNPKTAAKLAKTLLAQDPTNLVLWNTYAQLEWSRRRSPEARNVWAQTLVRFASKPEAGLLWISWARCEMEQDLSMAVKVLVAQTLDVDQRALALGNLEAVRVEPQDIARAKEVYRVRLEASISSEAAESCLTLHYATDDMESLEQTADFCLGRVDPSSLLAERIHMSLVRLIYVHAASRTSYRPGVLRKALERALQPFPSNTLFLHLYLLNESRTRIQNRVRNLLESKLQEFPRNESLWLFRAFAELHIDPSRRPNVDGISFIFERAVVALAHEPSVRVWLAYLKFAGIKPSLAKSVLFRAVEQCPWAKDLYMAAFQTIRPVFTPAELQKIYNTMQERELRLHVDLEPYSRIEMLNFGALDASEDEEMT